MGAELVSKAVMREAINELSSPEFEQNLQQAAYLLEDGLQGRFAHGKAYAMRQKDVFLQRCFALQTNGDWLRLTMIAMFANMFLAVWEPTDAGDPEWYARKPFFYIPLGLCALGVIVADFFMKAYYMKPRDYFKKNWQISHAVFIFLLCFDFFFVWCFGCHFFRFFRIFLRG